MLGEVLKKAPPAFYDYVRGVIEAFWTKQGGTLPPETIMNGEMVGLLRAGQVSLDDLPAELVAKVEGARKLLGIKVEETVEVKA